MQGISTSLVIFIQISHAFADGMVLCMLLHERGSSNQNYVGIGCHGIMTKDPHLAIAATMFQALFKIIAGFIM